MTCLHKLKAIFRVHANKFNHAALGSADIAFFIKKDATRCFWRVAENSTRVAFSTRDPPSDAELILMRQPKQAFALRRSVRAIHAIAHLRRLRLGFGLGFFVFHNRVAERPGADDERELQRDERAERDHHARREAVAVEADAEVVHAEP